MSLPFVAHSDGTVTTFSEFEEMDAYQERPGDRWRDHCHDCGEEIAREQDGYCEVCSEDRAAMYGDDDYGDHGPLDSDPYDREPGPF